MKLINDRLDLKSSPTPPSGLSASLHFMAFSGNCTYSKTTATLFNPSRQLKTDFKLFHWGKLVTIRWSKTIQFHERVVEISIAFLIRDSVWVNINASWFTAPFSTQGSPSFKGTVSRYCTCTKLWFSDRMLQIQKM